MAPETRPHNIPLVALGTGLLWFGWFGFNAGSALEANAIAALAFINTQIAASFAAVVWMFMEWKLEGKPRFVGFMTGSIAGLVAITPCAGFVSMTSSALIGVFAAFVCYFAVHIKNKFGWDDALDVWGVHGVGGIFGSIAVGIFASTAINPDGVNGLLFGGTYFFLKQVVAVVGASIFAFITTYLLLAIINIFTPVKVSVKHENMGLDEALHGEKAYTYEEFTE